MGIDGNKSYRLKGDLVKKFMREKVTMKIGIRERFCLGHKACY
jgi:hypothetical protein